MKGLIKLIKSRNFFIDFFTLYLLIIALFMVSRLFIRSPYFSSPMERLYNAQAEEQHTKKEQMKDEGCS